MSKNFKLYISVILAVARKDLRMELRNKEMIPLMLIFALVVSLIFGFLDLSFGNIGERNMDLYSGVFWISILFASILGFSRSAMIEKEAGGLVQFLSIPVDSSAVFFGKLIPNVLFLFSLSGVDLFFRCRFFDVDEKYFGKPKRWKYLDRPVRDESIAGGRFEMEVFRQA